jgi:hypothetical protein
MSTRNLEGSNSLKLREVAREIEINRNSDWKGLILGVSGASHIPDDPRIPVWMRSYIYGTADECIRRLNEAADRLLCS